MNEGEKHGVGHSLNFNQDGELTIAYSGLFNKGKEEGMAYEYNRDRDMVYHGNWTNFKADGFGIYENLASGERYEGVFRAGKRHGMAIHKASKNC